MAKRGGRALRAVLVGIAAALLGLPFAAGAGAARLSLSGKALPGMAGAGLLVLAMYALSGLQGALMTAGVAVALVAASRAGMPPVRAAACAAAAAMAGALLGLFEGPGILALTAKDLEQVLSQYPEALFPSALRNEVATLLVYLSPGTGAVQMTAGAAVATAFYRAIGGPGLEAREEIRLGLLPAWIVIAALVVLLLPALQGDLPERLTANVLVFMTAPYFAVGASVAGALFRTGPAMVFPALFVAIIAPPAAMAAIVLAGVLDTWLDFRKRIRSRSERPPQ